MSAILSYRKEYAISTAAHILLDCGVETLPVHVGSIAKLLNIPCISYQALAAKSNCTVQDIIDLMESSDGSAICVNGSYSVAYNKNAMVERKRFTVAHEIGHIVLGHLDQIDGFKLPRSTYGVARFHDLEQEANDFARNLLAPPAAHALRCSNSLHATGEYFQISRSCASMRCTSLQSDLSLLEEGLKTMQTQQFYEFVTKRAGGMDMENKCMGNGKKACGVSLDPYVTRCPYCGARTMQYIRGKFAIHDRDLELPFV